MLTGIERQLLEERLAAERAAALERAEAERMAAARAAEAAAVLTSAAELAPPAAPRNDSVRWPAAAPATFRLDRRAASRFAGGRGGRSRPRRPWMPSRRPATADTAPEPVQPGIRAEPVAAEPIAIARRVDVAEPSQPWTVAAAAPARSAVRDDQLLAFGLALTPVIGAGLIWLIAYLRGDLSLSIEELRPIALALLAVGPAGALAALAARAWYPRLQGLVTITALTALVLVGRVLLG